MLPESVESPAPALSRFGSWAKKISFNILFLWTHDKKDKEHVVQLNWTQKKNMTYEVSKNFKRIKLKLENN
jgi:hypothetical protein